MQNSRLLTPRQLAGILGINETALDVLVQDGTIPHTTLPAGNGVVLRFMPKAINIMLENSRRSNMNDEKYIERFKRNIYKKYPEELKRLHEFNQHFTEIKEPKGYCLSKVKNKKTGFVYYVRYTGVSSRWSTHTNIREMAERFAIENKERLINEYQQSNNPRKVSGELYSIMKNYYKEKSPYLQIDRKRGRVLGERTRTIYHNVILQH